MGFIVENNDNGIGGEARRESFILYRHDNDDFVELLWKQLPELEFIIEQLKETGYHKEWLKDPRLMVDIECPDCHGKGRCSRCHSLGTIQFYEDEIPKEVDDTMVQIIMDGSGYTILPITETEKIQKVKDVYKEHGKTMASVTVKWKDRKKVILEYLPHYKKFFDYEEQKKEEQA